jgi:hypothetical protein
MTTNISEVFNFVLKCIHSLPVSGIVDYIFTSVTSISFIGGKSTIVYGKRGALGGT